MPTLRRKARRILPTDPVESSVIAGLRYVRDTTCGILRQRAGRGFCYLDAQGKRIRDDRILERIRSLVIPPAWERVWICPSSNGHLQAVGFDARGRKQYRYHPLYRQVRNETKYARIPAFAEALPGIRRKVKEHLSMPGLSREKVLATVARLLETTFIRVGNEAYAHENHSFGLTTMRDKHVEVDGSTVRFHFVGKSGVEREVEISDRKLARIVKSCQDLPGQQLFQYVDESGERRVVDSEDVNTYLKEISGQDFTAKFFRTWAGTVHCAAALREIGEFGSQTQAKKNVVAAIKSTAQRLGNRPATCSAYYVHPAIPEAYLEGILIGLMRQSGASSASPDDLTEDEMAVLGVLEHKGFRP